MWAQSARGADENERTGKHEKCFSTWNTSRDVDVREAHSAPEEKKRKEIIK